MIIRIITCHDVYNYGASLQAYALSTYLINNGHDAKIIDYKPDYLSHHYEFGYVDENNRFFPLCKKYKIFKFLYGIRLIPITYATWRRIKPFDNFKKKYLKCTERYNSLNELRSNPPIADLYIAGSDQIWNCNLPNGKDEAFYLGFGSPKRKISYAASFAMKYIPECYKNMLIGYLKNIDMVSVREKSAVAFVNDLGYKSTAVIDPVFLLNKSQWEDFAKKPPLIKDNYILVYNLNRGNTQEIKEEAKNLSKEEDAEIVSIDSSFKCKFSNRNIHNAGPIEFVNLIMNAKYVVTDSFHGMSFSLIMQRPFSIWHKHSDSSRIYDLLSDLDAVHCMNNSIRDNSFHWDKIEDRINTLRTKAYSFLEINMKTIKIYG